jgi:Dolichyl-phosphate-mannose-protein mannosyltransferase
MSLDLGFLILLAIIAAGLGFRVLGWLRVTPEHPLDAWALAVPLGLGGLALAVLGLAEVGALTLWAIGGLLAVGFVLGGKGGITGTLAIRPRVSGRDGVSFAFDILLGLTLLGTFLTSLAPVTDGDALCYHLQVPKVFLAQRSAVFEPDLHETIYPLVTEALYAVALALRGPVSCRLIQWLLGLTFAANVAAIARPVLGDRARWAGTIALLVPAVSNGMGAPLNDVALAAFGNAAIHAWIRWRDRPSWRSAALAGAFVGLAIGVKYPALVLGGLLGIGFLAGRRRVLTKSASPLPPGEGPGVRGMASPTAGEPLSSGSAGLALPIMHDRQGEPCTTRKPFSRGEGGRDSAITHAFLFGLVALVVGGGWYLRAYIHTGNPVYPFFRQVFGGAGIDEVLDPIKRPMAVTVWNLLTSLGPLTLQPGRFDSFSHQFGPMFLLFLPALLWTRPPRRIVGVVAIGYAFLILCLTQRQSMRFVLIAIGPLSVGVAWLASTWYSRRSVPGRLLIGLLLAAMMFETTLAIARARHGLRVVLGRESAESFLTRREPTFVVGRWMAANLPEDARVVGQDHRGYYLPRAYSMELAHRRRTGLGKNGESAEGMIEGLKAAGFTHVLFCPPVPENAVEFDPTLGRLLAPWLDEGRPLYRKDLGDADGVVRRYAIYALDRPFEEARR